MTVRSEQKKYKLGIFDSHSQMEQLKNSFYREMTGIKKRDIRKISKNYFFYSHFLNFKFLIRKNGAKNFQHRGGSFASHHLQYNN